MSYRDRRLLHLHPSPAGQLVASVHGVVDADAAQRVADRLAQLAAPGTREVHLDVDQANPLSAAAAAVLFFPLLQALRAGDPPVALTVHRADPRTRGRLLELGLDPLLAHSDHRV
ncbi:hypothetical protein [Streptacidiphilus sp. PAMC 29251]